MLIKKTSSVSRQLDGAEMLEFVEDAIASAGVDDQPASAVSFDTEFDAELDQDRLIATWWRATGDDAEEA